VGLERGPLSLVRINEELLEWKSSCSGYRKPRLTVAGIRCADHATPLSTNLAVTLLTSGGRSVGMVDLRTKATEFTTLSTKIRPTIFLDVSPCRPVLVHRSLAEPYHLHVQSRSINQASSFIFTTVTAINPTTLLILIYINIHWW
jgi:hypothetical protein